MSSQAVHSLSESLSALLTTTTIESPSASGMTASSSWSSSRTREPCCRCIRPGNLAAARTSVASYTSTTPPYSSSGGSQALIISPSIYSWGLSTASAAASSSGNLTSYYNTPAASAPTTTMMSSAANAPGFALATIWICFLLTLSTS